jgi:4-hydroxy-tetrahydrodipicolinate synthase
MTEPAPLRGVFAAVLTPLAPDLAPNHGRLARHCRWLLANGCDGLSPLGTTGEANSFSAVERIAIMEGLVAAGLPAARLMPGTGCAALTDTVELTRKAVELGCGGVLMLPPFYYKSVSDDGLFASYAEVIERVGDRRLRVYLYHFPQMSAVPLSHALIRRLLDRYPGTVAGIKDSSGDLGNMVAMARTFPDFAVFSGWDHLLWPLLKEGGAGCITAVANIAAPLAQRIFAGWRDGDVAAPHDQLEAVRKAVEVYPLTAALKEIMARHVGDDGWRIVRPPMTTLSEEKSRDLLARLARTGYKIPSG